MTITDIRSGHFNGTLLYARRYELGWSLRVVASKVGVATPAVNAWERYEGKCIGKRIYAPSASNLVKLAKALKVKPEYFYGTGIKLK